MTQMVLISPRIEHDEQSPCSGKLVVSFPPESGCLTFEVPLNPTPEILSRWELWVEVSNWSGNAPLTTPFLRVDECTMFKVVNVDGYICQAVDPTSPSPSEVLSKYFGRPVHLVMKGPKYRACGTTQTFPDLVASALFQDRFPLLIASDESLEKVSDEINQWASGEVGGVSIGGIDDLWKTGRLSIERYVDGNTPVTGSLILVGGALDSGQTLYSAVPVCHL